MPLGLDGQRERRKNRQDAGDHPDAAAQSRVVIGVLTGFVGNRQKTPEQPAHPSRLVSEAGVRAAAAA
jgi:hypothetical protein